MSVPLNRLSAGPDYRGGTHTPISDLPQEQVDAIIRTKRKAREPKACYPCHTRKVKCDRNLPCDGCVKRDHADLCSYERPSKKRQVLPQVSEPSNGGESSYQRASTAELPAGGSGGGVGGRISLARDEWENVCAKLKEMEQTISSLRTGMEQADTGHIPSPDIANGSAGGASEGAFPEREGILAANELGNGTVHLGSRSVLAYILGRSGTSQETTQALLEGGILPKMGLDNESATYPFVDLWSSDASIFDVNAVCSALPDDTQCRMYLGYYRDVAATLYPVIPDFVQFTATMDRLLQKRAEFGGTSADTGEGMDKPYGVKLSSIGLLFAALAAGCICSDMSGKERELTSQVYVCCAYQCLRMTNFLSQPTYEAIQTLLIIGNVLSYNMNPGCSYVLLGMTLRMGLSLGLHVESNKFSSAEKYIRRRIWWSMAWQDSHFSLSYDRPSTIAFCQPDIPYVSESQPKNRAYFETLCRIISLTLGIVRSRMLAPESQMSLKVVQAYKEEIHHVLEDAAPYLRDPTLCHYPSQHLERLALKLHSSYITSELCRPALKTNADMNDATTLECRKDCVKALFRTVEAYVETHSIDSRASRSWIGIQRAISSGFLLAVLKESIGDSNTLHLLRQLEAVIAERVAAGGDYQQGATSRSAQATPRGFGDFIDGVTNVNVPAFDPLSIGTATIPAQMASDAQSQWTKPLAKSLKALQKLNFVLAAHTKQQETVGGYLVPSAAESASNISSAPSLSPAVGPTIGPAIGTRRGSSLPPPTPDSSSSGDWTYPNLLDRAAEYIHPPLWS